MLSTPTIAIVACCAHSHRIEIGTDVATSYNCFVVFMENAKRKCDNMLQIGVGHW